MPQHQLQKLELVCRDSRTPVIKIIGRSVFLERGSRCRPGPVIPGIRTSRIRQSVVCTWFDLKNASAEEKPCTLNPTDRIRSSRELLSASSSSTIEMRGTLGTGCFFSFLQFRFSFHPPQGWLRILEIDRRAVLSPGRRTAPQNRLMGANSSVYSSMVQVVRTL